MHTKIDKNLPLFNELKDKTDENRKDINININDIEKLDYRVTALEEKPNGNVDIATLDKTGIVKPDGTTITITTDGTISSISSAPVDVYTKKEIDDKFDSSSEELHNYIDESLENKINININGDVTGTIDFSLNEKDSIESNLTMNGNLKTNINNIWDQINYIKDNMIISSDTKNYILYDSSNYDNYKEKLLFTDSQWSESLDTPLTLDEVINKQSSVLDSNNNLCLNTDIFGWESTVKIIFTEPILLTADSTLRIIYTSTTAAEDIDSSILSDTKFSSESEGNFYKILSLWNGEETETFLDINYKLENIPSDLSTEKYLELYTVLKNPRFIIKKIEVQTPIQS
jgi:hypothetical protein